ncbi:PREDICTED: glutaminase kidney isoform, mitochondrial-like [Amphimedon queenslandica]|uniref:glutaminase n=1 Tax=Amphimedon queenslandica TaxID=400682 RepID=A0A1X7UL00_AMPQE|nr:PREDICTED: glutaminase kidney isoform, mitochondrial-like [Amphimedon queenslandica]|eukprot:XP_003387447.1 PREDICTED: glutaminase kidney isoform, mitochondrial-like [Amphimedon queenslandica]
MAASLRKGPVSHLFSSISKIRLLYSARLLSSDGIRTAVTENNHKDKARVLAERYSLDGAKVKIDPFLQDLVKTGLKLENDPRLLKYHKMNGVEELHINEFISAVQDDADFLQRAVEGKLVVEDFDYVKSTIDNIYNECSEIKGGKNASYIPELSLVDPSLWGISLCTVDGQRHSVGDSSTSFTIQSAGKCFNYAIGCDEIGRERVHQYIGMEPSGAHFNRMALNNKSKPHNPMINSGALVLSSLIKPRLSLHERMGFLLRKFDELAGLPPRSIKIDTITCDSEMEHCDKNMALIYYMKSKKSLPSDTSIDDTIKLYTRLCSIEIDCYKGAVMAATLANGGVCPITNKQVVTPASVRHTLTLMHSCGMYDFSGEFAFNVGLPAKSGVSGVIVVVVPHIMGLCLYSPPVNDNGNSVKGLEFCRRLSKDFHFHLYHSQFHQHQKF